VNRGKSDKITGYNIYLSETSLKNDFKNWDKGHPAPHNFTPYPGDTDGDKTKESYEITHLQNGKTYFVSVRTLGLNGVESAPSNEVSFTPLSRGTFTISSNHSADNGGFDLESGISVSARNLRCDIYLYAKDDEVGLSSPSRLGTGLRKTWFGRPGRVYVKEMDSILIKKGEKITTSSKSGDAELTILKIERDGSAATATIEYVFYPQGYVRQ